MSSASSEYNEPTPKLARLNYSPPIWPIRGRHYLSVPQKASYCLFRAVLQRRSRREFGPLSETDLASFFWYTAKSEHVLRRGKEAAVRLTRFPSSGGLSSIGILHFTRSKSDIIISLYDCDSHALLQMEPVGSSLRAYNAFSDILDPQRGDILLYFSDSEIINSCYNFGESLLWRDAGVMLGGMSLVAEAIGLAFCPIGTSGRDSLRQVFNDDRFVALGAAVLGARG